MPPGGQPPGAEGPGGGVRAVPGRKPGAGGIPDGAAGGGRNGGPHPVGQQRDPGAADGKRPGLRHHRDGVRGAAGSPEAAGIVHRGPVQPAPCGPGPAAGDAAAGGLAAGYPQPGGGAAAGVRPGETLCLSDGGGMQRRQHGAGGRRPGPAVHGAAAGAVSGRERDAGVRRAVGGGDGPGGLGAADCPGRLRPAADADHRQHLPAVGAGAVRGTAVSAPAGGGGDGGGAAGPAGGAAALPDPAPHGRRGDPVGHRPAVPHR